MSGVIIGDFGEKDGYRLYRVNGKKEDLYKIIDECRKAGEKFEDTPILELVHNNQWTMLLKIKVAVSVGREKD